MCEDFEKLILLALLIFGKAESWGSQIPIQVHEDSM